MANTQPISIDASGFEVLTAAMQYLLEQYPGLNGREIMFEEIGEEAGIAFSADAGALVMTERRSITDHVVQQCQYPFIVVYRTTATREYQKLNVQAFLDSLGKWLCREAIEIDGTEHQLTGYPTLAGGRKITRVTRSNSYGTAPNENGSQDWLLPVTVEYVNEFDLY